MHVPRGCALVLRAIVWQPMPCYCMKSKYEGLENSCMYHSSLVFTLSMLLPNSQEDRSWTSQWGTYIFLFLLTGSESREAPPNDSYASHLALCALVTCFTTRPSPPFVVDFLALERKPLLFLPVLSPRAMSLKVVAASSLAACDLEDEENKLIWY